ncbi:MAG: T9SS type A sorting domain-containing protein [Bacteroidota bacterium]
MKRNNIQQSLWLVLILWWATPNDTQAQAPNCQLAITPQVHLSTSGNAAVPLQSVIYAIDGNFYRLEMPFQTVTPQQPLVLTLPAMDLEPGMHVLDYYVKTQNGEKVTVVPELAVSSEEMATETMATLLQENESPLQTCACSQLLDGEAPDAGNLFNFQENAEGDYVLFTSPDKGKAWVKVPVAERSDNGCPQFALAAPVPVTAKSAAKPTLLPALDWTAFPSPFAGELNLRLQLSQKENLRIRLLDTQGRVIQELSQKDVQGTFNHQFNTGGLAQGPYYLTVTTDRATYSRVVIRH